MNNNTVTKEQVQENMKDIIVRTLDDFGKPTTYVTVKMKNGFTLRESTTCVDPANYDENIGKEICLKKIEDKVWFLLGYALQDKLSKSTHKEDDERIRKNCIHFLELQKKHHASTIEIDECIAWLEKQGKKSIDDLTQQEAMDIAVAKCFEQGEPKQEENDQKCAPFRIKKGEWYVCIHDFCNKGIKVGEIIQAEHDDTIRGIGFLYMENKYFRPAFENEKPQFTILTPQPMPQKNSDQIERRKMRIIESYQVPKGNVSPDIFALPCITSAYKTMTQGIRYHVDYMIAKPSDWICKDENGEWLVLTDNEYKEAQQ